MNDSDLDLMYERTSESIWEGLAKPEYSDLTVQKVKLAAEELELALKSVNLLAEALGESPLGDRAVSIADGLEDLLSGMNAIKKRMGVN